MRGRADADADAVAICHTVTRGLDADAPLRASGVEWLGDVPAH